LGNFPCPAGNDPPQRTQEQRRPQTIRRDFDVQNHGVAIALQFVERTSGVFQIKDRVSFIQFLGLNWLGLNWQSRVPDQKTIWLFREQLTKAGLVKPLFDRFEQLLASVKQLWSPFAERKDVSFAERKTTKCDTN